MKLPKLLIYSILVCFFIITFLELIVIFAVKTSSSITVQEQLVNIRWSTPKAYLLFDFDSELIWKTKKSFSSPLEKTDRSYLNELVKPLQTNSLGYRNKEFNLKKKSSIRNILAIGQSTTFGVGIPNNLIWTQRLENKLNYKNNLYRVINAGAVGYSTYQNVILMSRELRKLSPDIIIADVGVNDTALVKYPDHQVAHLYSLTDFLSNSALFRLVFKLVAKHSYHNNTKNFSFKQARVPVANFKQNLLRMIQLAKANHTKIIFLNFPPIGAIVQKSEDVESPPDRGKTPYKLLNEYRMIIKTLAAIHDVPFLDLKPPFSNSPLGKKLFIDWVHNSLNGHELVATELSKLIQHINGGT